MIKFVTLAVVALQAGVFAWAEPARRTIPFGGFERSYLVHEPSRARFQDAALVLVLHGLGGTGSDALNQGKWIGKADTEGFIVVAPEGLPENPDRTARFFGNPRSWNSGPATGSRAAERGVDDVGFIRTVIAQVRRDHRVDSGRIYVTGFSNGAAMAFRVGAELSDVVTAIAPVGNGLLAPVDTLQFPVSLILVWGTADPLNPIGGGTVNRGGQSVVRPSAESSWRRWASLLECSSLTADDRTVPRVRRRSFVGCARGSEAVLVEIEGLGHQWPGGQVVLRLVSGPGSDAFDATAEIWKFFAAHSR